MTQEEFLNGVAALFEQYCRLNGVNETAKWSLSVQFKDGKAVATQP